MDYKLNESQTRAVEINHPRILCLAGAGTGKTRTLTARIQRLHEERVGTPNMTALTFTRMAGQEIKRRLAEHIGQHESRRMFCDTFHAFAVRIISEYGYKIGIKYGFTIYDDLDRESIFNRIIKDSHLEANAKTSMELYTRDERAQEATMADFSGTPNDRIRKKKDHERLIKEYEHRLAANNAVDLSRLIDHAVTLLEFPEIAAVIRESCKHLFVDEYQDTSVKQNRMIELINPENLFVVGDDYQSIYEWRDAHPEFIVFLSKDAGWQTIRLETNYRSTGPIIEVANGIIQQNKNRTEKNLVPFTKEAGRISANIYNTLEEEADAIAWMAQTAPDTPLAILCRTNKQAAQIGHALRDRGCPAATISGKYDPMRRPHVRQLIQFLQLAVNPEDNHALLGTITGIKQYIKADDLALAKNTAQIMDTSVLEQIRKNDSAPAYIKLIDDLQEQEVAADALNMIIERTGITDANESAGLDNRNEDIWETLYRINKWEARQLAAGESVSPMAFCQWVMIKDIQAGLLETADQPIKVMTIHAAKGLEFERVTIPQINKGTFPSARGNMEEERRLFFVAITRAERELYINATMEEEAFSGSKRRAQPSDFYKKAAEIVKTFAINK
jgi:DNA helicase-2/ATP-dependent DNA helicase PcrA